MAIGINIRSNWTPNDVVILKSYHAKSRYYWRLFAYTLLRLSFGRASTLLPARPGFRPMLCLKMSMERLRNPEKKMPEADLRDVTQQLQEEAFEMGPGSIAQSPRTYHLSRSVTPDKLELLGDLSFENLMLEVDDKLVLSTGRKESTEPNYFRHVLSTKNGARELRKAEKLTDSQQQNSRFTLHNHPATTLQGMMGLDLAVSDGDMRASEEHKGEIEFILTNKGIIGYEKQPRTLHFGLSTFVAGSRMKIKPLDGPNRILKKQRKEGITRFFIPFRGDEESQRKLELICQYINDPTMKWGPIKAAIES